MHSGSKKIKAPTWVNVRHNRHKQPQEQKDS